MRVSTLNSLNTAGWNDAVVLYPDGKALEHKTLCSRAEMEEFCQGFGYQLLAFRTGIKQLSDRKEVPMDERSLGDFKHMVAYCNECFGRYLVVVWNEDIEEKAVAGVLDDRYGQWHNLDEFPDAEDWCLEEWQRFGLDDMGLDYHCLYVDDGAVVGDLFH